MRYGATLQKHWDWRAAVNFMFGGCGGSLLLLAVFVGPGNSIALAATLLGIALMGLGLTAVWLEIGRPWRAANVMRKPQNSWMTREAYVASLAVGFAFAALLAKSAILAWIAGLAGIAFVFCQGQILLAAKGIPAWRERAVVGLIVATGAVEGLAVIQLLMLGVGIGHGYWPVALLTALVIRLAAWLVYRSRLLAGLPPVPVVTGLAQLGITFVGVGHIASLLLLVFAWFKPDFGFTLALAAILAIYSGWHMKFVLVTRLAHQQGYGLGRLQSGHPLVIAGHSSVAEASTRLRKTRAAASEGRSRA